MLDIFVTFLFMVGIYLGVSTVLTLVILFLSGRFDNER